MGPTQAIRAGFAKSFQFAGRASRFEFWWFFAGWLVLTLGLFALVGWTSDRLHGGLPTIVALKCLKAAVYVMLFLPLSAIARRHHDVGFPAFIALLAVLPATILLINSMLFIPLMLGVVPFALESFVMNSLLLGGEVFVAYLILITISSLVALLPSAPQPNRYGPGPHDLNRFEIFT